MRLHPPSLTAFVLALVCAGCGARTGLDLREAGADASVVDVAPDVPAVLPSCVAALAPGALRFRVAGVAGRVAVGPDGTVYAPYVTPGRGRGVVAVDACGQELWRRPSVEPARGGRILLGEARISSANEALLTGTTGDANARGIWRYALDGGPLPSYEVQDILTRFVALPAGSGPVVVTQQMNSTEGRVERYDLAGRRVFRQGAWSNVHECAVAGATLACLDAAFDMNRRRVLWSAPYEILDGTLRHALPPAVDGDRIYVAQFGISSYVLLAREIATGRVLWRSEIARSTLGQVDLLMGAPTVGTGGAVYVYLNIHRAGPYGQLSAFRRDGSLAWSFAAEGTRTDYQRFATHAVGDAGVVYLAVGRSVYAVGEDGRMRWRVGVAEGVNASAPTLSPTGDLLVHTDDDQLLAIATESRGLARTAWPVAGGDARNSNAR